MGHVQRELLPDRPPAVTAIVSHDPPVINGVERQYLIHPSRPAWMADPWFRAAPQSEDIVPVTKPNERAHHERKSDEQWILV